MKTLQTRGNTALYAIEPLEPGYGYTIGQALQRVLQSSLPGAAVIALRSSMPLLDDATIRGVREDVREIALNIKQVRLRCVSDHPVSMRLNVSGKRDVSAAHIMVPDTLEIVNPDVHIATLEQEHAHLTLELVVQMGRGYVPAEVYTGQPLDREMILDAIYSPVRKVSYTVEHTRVGKMVNFDRVLLSIETDGTLSPDDALHQSASILMRQFLVFTDMAVPELRKSSTSSAVAIPQNVYNFPLNRLGFSMRIYNSFKRKGITTVGQILVMDEEEFLGIRNVGEKSIPAIIEALRTSGCFPPFLEDAPEPE